MQNQVNLTESRIFWSGLWSITGMWVLFFIISFFSINFKWLVSRQYLAFIIYNGNKSNNFCPILFQLLVSIALTLNIANLHGYIKCKSGNQENSGISSMASNFLFQNIGKVRLN